MNALATAKGYVAEVAPRIAKAAQSLKATTSMSAEQLANTIKAFQNVSKTAAGHRQAVRAELRAAIRTAADGEEVSDEYSDASSALNEIVNLAETALDQLGEGDDEGAPKEASAEEVTAGAEEVVAAEEEAAVEVAAEAGTEAAAVAEANAAIQEAAAPQTAARKTAGKRIKAEEALEVLLDGLQDLIQQVSDTNSGENDTVVNLDENGVVQDDPSVDQVLNDAPVDAPVEAPEAPIEENDDDLHANLAFFLDAADEEATATAAADPFTRSEKDPLAGKGAITANRTAARRDSVHANDLAILDKITSGLVR